jgi:hypothetical protein
MHLAPSAPNYTDYDTHNNYMDGVIVRPAYTLGASVRTEDGRWANCHPPNGRNLLKGAHGIRWWLRDDDQIAHLEEMYQFELEFYAD